MLRHLIAAGSRTTFRSTLYFSSATRTSSRSLFAQSKKTSGYVSTVRSNSGQERGKMAFGTLFGGVYLVVCVGLPLAVFGAGLVFSLFENVERSHEKKKEKQRRIRPDPCIIDYDHMPKNSKQCAEPKRSVKKSDRFEIGKVSFGLQPSFIVTSHVSLESYVDFELPYKNIKSDYKQICDDLKLCGIHVDQSEEGVRLGLTEYALKYMQKGVKEHVEKKCDCCLPVEATHTATEEKRALSFKLSPDAQDAPPEQSNTAIQFRRAQPQSNYYAIEVENRRVKHERYEARKMAEFSNGYASFEVKPLELTVYHDEKIHVRLASIVLMGPCPLSIDCCTKQYCEELERRGIHVQHTKDGVRYGLTQLALQYMHKGVNEHVQKK